MHVAIFVAASCKSDPTLESYLPLSRSWEVGELIRAERMPFLTRGPRWKAAVPLHAMQFLCRPHAQTEALPIIYRGLSSSYIIAGVVLSSADAYSPSTRREKGDVVETRRGDQRRAEPRSHA